MASKIQNPHDRALAYCTIADKYDKNGKAQLARKYFAAAHMADPDHIPAIVGLIPYLQDEQQYQWANKAIILSHAQFMKDQHNGGKLDVTDKLSPWYLYVVLTHRQLQEEHQKNQNLVLVLRMVFTLMITFMALYISC